MVWYTLSLQKEETASRYEGWLWICWISSYEHPKRGGHLAWWLGLQFLIIRRNQHVMKCYTGPLTWKALENVLTNLWVLWNAGNLSTQWVTITFKRKTVFHGVSSLVIHIGNILLQL
jgi:hypothetical protein